ncbi:MAG: glutamine amidotransferase-related protein [Oscillospiraceae bacterium]
MDPAIFDLGVPILGICYGCQLMAHTLGGQVTAAQDRLPPGNTARPRPTTTPPARSSRACLQEGISWMSHGDYMAKVPDGFALIAHTDTCPNVAIADEARGFYGVQFHPEVNHTEHGIDMIRNFLYEVCRRQGRLDHGGLLRTVHRRRSGRRSATARFCWPCPAV